MTDKPIQVGDLVYVARSCCNVRLGLVFTVTKLANYRLRCHYCHHREPGSLFAHTDFQPRPGYHRRVPVWMLRRFGPDSKPTEVDTEHLLTA